MCKKEQFSVLYVVFSFSVTWEHLEVPILCKTNQQKSVNFHFLREQVNQNYAHFFSTLHNSISTNKLIACLSTQTHYLLAGSIKKI